MIMQKLKDILCGVLITVLILGTVSTVFGKVSKESIIANYNNIKIIIDGKTLETEKEPFVYEGTTYLPIRAIGEAFGKTVCWDGEAKTVTIVSESEATNLEGGLATGNKASYSRTNPAPVNASQTIEVSGYSGEYTATVTVLEALRGEDALNMVKEANMLNRSPSEDKEYIVVKVKMDVENVKDDRAISVSKYMFDCFSENNVEYDMAFVVDPEPALSGDIYDGSSITGYMTLLVDKNDISPKIVFGRKYDGTGGIWFDVK
ncbi:MAG: stalk domain-containing protein [Lachnospiraceae bacterium]|nr:stalk domain-containing protein [Lachnospiraceae bacterium]